MTCEIYVVSPSVAESSARLICSQTLLRPAGNAVSKIHSVVWAFMSRSHNYELIVVAISVHLDSQESNMDLSLRRTHIAKRMRGRSSGSS